MKILVVRFSSIGDIVLTTPILRAIKRQLPTAEIHYLTKKSFSSLVDINPHLSKVFTIEKSIQEVLPQLIAEQYDFLVDLHNNLRTASLKRKLRIPSAAFPKLNISKWLLVNFKWNKLPNVHIVDRYFEAVKSIQVVNDGKPCEFFLLPEDEVDVTEQFQVATNQFVALAIGAQFATKRLPTHKLVEIINQIEHPVILLGGLGDTEIATEICAKTAHKQVVNACGKLTLRQSASVVKQAAVILTHDTGLMHIASAFQIPTVSVWGNTVPELGMYPYFPSNKTGFSMHEVENLTCRPCSKIGFQACPKKHFNCMEKQNSEVISSDVNQRFNQ